MWTQKVMLAALKDSDERGFLAVEDEIKKGVPPELHAAVLRRCYERMTGGKAMTGRTRTSIQTMLLGKLVNYWTDKNYDPRRSDPGNPCPEGRKHIPSADVETRTATVLNVYLDADGEPMYTISDEETGEVKQTAWIGIQTKETS
jgi:hypothetical protein